MEHHPKPDELSPFERLKRFARAIVAVPKSEITEQETEYQRKRGQEKALRTKKSLGR
jgi:hypothetical protein